MQNPPPNRNQRSSPKYFSQLALAATLGDESQIHGAPTVRQRRRIGLDQNALISLAVIFSVVLISVLVVGIYNSQSTAKALPARETKDYSAQDLTQKSRSQPETMSGYKTESQERETNEQIIVYVSGAVNRPGVVELPLDARVNDALQAAGGPQENADINLVNLAQTISDGAQIHVPVKGEPALGEPSPGVQQGQGVRGSKGQTVAGSAGAENPEGSRQKVNLNTATVEQLDQIPGIGAITAREILNWRAQNGPFQSLEDLLQVSRIGQKTLEKLRPYLTL